MTNLKPCPFCGGRPFINKGYEYYWITCKECGAEVSARTSDNEAIEAWNTRAERKCRDCIIAAIPNGETPNGQALVLERTCHAEYRTGGNEIGAFYCSACNNYMDENDRYCPSCGAKVVE